MADHQIKTKLFAGVSAILLLCGSAVCAEPALTLGGVFSFGWDRGSDFGVAVGFITNNQADKVTFGGAATYYPVSGDFGTDVFAGWVFDNGVLGAGYDFSQRAPTVSLSYANVDQGHTASPPPP